MRPFCIHLEYINMVQIRASVGKGREQKSVFRFSWLILAGQRADSANDIFKYLFHSHSLSLSEAFEGCRNDHEIPEWHIFIRPVFLHDNIIKCIHQGVIFQTALFHCHKQLPHLPGLRTLWGNSYFFRFTFVGENGISFASASFFVRSGDDSFRNLY